MRRVPSSFPFRRALTKSLSVALCLALIGLETGPVFARNNDDYQNNAYSSNYGPRGGYSASNFELQMQQARARIQSFVAPPVQNFDSFRYTAPKLNLTYQRTIRFQYSLQAKAPDINTKPIVKLDTIASVQKPTFVQAVGAVFKGIGAAITSAFKKIGDGIVSFTHKIFGPNQKQEVPVTPQSQDLMGSFKNLKEIAPGLLQTQNGKTTALGQTWEPGSTFKAEGKNLRLVEGTAYAPNFGGITRGDGANFPVRFADDAGKVKPIGLDFNLMAKETPLKIQAPLNIEGFGKISAGDMTFKGAIETQAESFREVQRGMRGVTNELVSILPNIDADRLKAEAPVPDQELARRAATYFPEAKAVVSHQTEKTLGGIKSLVTVGAMAPEQGAKLGAQMMAMRDKILSAVPNDALYDQKRAVADPLQKTYDTSKNLVNRATDAAFFYVMGMEKLAEKYPKTGEAVGKFYLGEAKLAQAGAAAVGTAGLAYFAVTATITTGASIETAYVVKNVLEYVGVNKEASTAYAAATSFLVAAKLGESSWIKGKEAKISEAVISKVSFMVRNVRAFVGDSLGLISNESGQILVPGKTTTPSQSGSVPPVQKFATISTPYGDALQSMAPEALAARNSVQNGQALYKIGRIGKSEGGEAQFWAMENPLSPGFESRYGMPPGNLRKGGITFVEIGELKPGTPFVTRRAPPVGNNPGGGIEVVVAPGGIDLRSFSAGRRKP